MINLNGDPIDMTPIMSYNTELDCYEITREDLYNEDLKYCLLVKPNAAGDSFRYAEVEEGTYAFTDADSDDTDSAGGLDELKAWWEALRRLRIMWFQPIDSEWPATGI